MTKQEQNRYLLIGGSVAVGYYFGGKNTKGALIGLGVALVLLYVAKNGMGLMAAGSNGLPVGAPEPSTGGLPAPGTTDDPLGGTVMPGGKRIGILR